MRDDRLHPVQRRLHVDAHHQIELLVRQLEHRLRDAAAGVVDPDVDVSEPLDRAIAQALHVAAVGDVGGNDERDIIAGAAAARAPGDVVQFGFATRGQNETMTRGPQLEGEGRADAAARAGDDDGPRGCHSARLY